MYAVIETGGKQYRVKQGDVIDVELVETTGKDSSKVTFDRVLMIGGDKPAIGTPVLAGAAVTADVVDPIRARKIRVFKKKRRKGMRRTKGHRATYTRVRVKDILL